MPLSGYVALSDVLDWLQPYSALKIGEYLVERKKFIFLVTTPYGKRQVKTTEEVFILLRGGWFCNKCRAEPGIDHFKWYTSQGQKRYKTICKTCKALRKSLWDKKQKRKPGYLARKRANNKLWRAKNHDHCLAYQREHKPKYKRAVAWWRVMEKQGISP